MIPSGVCHARGSPPPNSFLSTQNRAVSTAHSLGVLTEIDTVYILAATWTKGLVSTSFRLWQSGGIPRPTLLVKAIPALRFS